MKIPGRKKKTKAPMVDHPPKPLPGARADSPRQVPLKGWWQALKRVVKEVDRDHLFVVGAGVAFYWFMAFIPAFGTLIAVYGLLFTPADVIAQLDPILVTLPPQAAGLLEEQLMRLAAASDGSLTVGVVIGLLVALWSANAGTKALVRGVSVAYEERGVRSFFAENGLTLLMTVGGIIVCVIALAAIVLLPIVLGVLGLGAPFWVDLVRWPLLLAVIVVALAVTYRYGPKRHNAKWRWITPGAIVATVLWLLATGGFALYVTWFGDYEATYGSLSAVVVLLFWLWVTAFAVLVGAELNAELELQTRRDSTTGPPKEMGKRGAWVADHYAGDLTGR